MKGIKRFVLFIFVVVLFEVKLFSLITSRIEGVVSDFDTGAVIIGAEVHLFHVSYKTVSNPKIKTFNDGRFRFDDLQQGEYYISVYKEGYELYGPFTREELEEDKSIQFPPPLSIIKLITNPIKGRIYLKEGEVKHFKISLRKEAIVEVLFFKKTEQGETPIKSILGSGNLRLKVSFCSASIVLPESKNDGFKSEVVISPSISEPGKVTFNNLSGEQNVNVHVYAYDYPRSIYEVYLNSGETTTIHHVLDFTSGMVVHGFIRPKNIEEPLYLIYGVILKGSNYRVRGIIENNEEFWIKGMEEGKCKLRLEFFKKSGGRGLKVKEVVVLDLKKDKRIELDLMY
jgi:hypothetical protein